MVVDHNHPILGVGLAKTKKTINDMLHTARLRCAGGFDP